MVPLVDDFLQMYITNKLRFLRKYPTLIDRIFTSGKRKTLQNLKEFILNKPVKVVLGYPRDQATLPCYSIVLAPEQEIPLGLGDNTGDFEGFEYDDELTEPTDETKINLAIKQMSDQLSGVYMNSTYRIECWSDNADLTTYMYAILKWCLWTSKLEMLKLGWVDIKLSGTDLEPAPDYMPIFIYRRSVQINLTYENLYYDNLELIELYLQVCQNPSDYDFDNHGNVIRKSDGEIIIPKQIRWILTSRYFQELTGIEMTKQTREYNSEDQTWPLIKGDSNG